MLVALILIAAGTGQVSLPAIAATLASAPSWQAAFEQVYVPTGLDEGASDSGVVVAAAPRQIRFEYAGEDGRVFAFDGEVARMVDAAVGACDAVRLDADAADAVPLAVLVDPERSGELFEQRYEGEVLVLTPRTPSEEIAVIRVAVGPQGLPTSFTIIDRAGNRNQFTFSGWAPRQGVEPSLFRPSLPGAPPCEPAGG